MTPKEIYEALIDGKSVRELSDITGRKQPSIRMSAARHARDNNLPSYGEVRGIAKRKKGSVQSGKVRSGLSKAMQMERDRRVEELSKCEVDDCGVTKCPDRYLDGYGLNNRRGSIA